MMKNLIRAFAMPALLFITAGATSCSHQQPFVWVDELPLDDSERHDVYRVRPGDHLTITVWNQERLSGEYPVRTDGHMTFPLVGDVNVSGMTPTEVSHLVGSGITDVVPNPNVTVSLTSTEPRTVAVLGEVRNAGHYPIKKGDGVLQALAAAGGLTEFADRDEIFVLRRAPQLTRIRFDFARLIAGQGRAAQFQLRDGDVIVVD